MRRGWSAARRCWPYMLVATGLVTVLPAGVATLAVPSGSAVRVAGTLVLALIASLAAAKIGAALWMRHPLARDVVFADLMVWEWLRRLWVEHRLVRAQAAISNGDGAPHTRAAALARLARLLEARDAYTHGHSQRVARHALRIAQALRLPAVDAARIWTAATLHDIGKIDTPREILNKSGRLSDAEFDVIKRHPVDGAAMLVEIGDPQIVAIVRSHHERLDGAGYPDGLAGAEIPLGARIIAVADTFDALTSTRSYRSAATHKRALDILRKEAGAQLDGAAVAAFLRTYSGRRPAAWSALLTLGPERAIAWVGHQATGVASLAPAAGWIAPVAAAAAALVGTSAHVADHAAQRAPAGATPIAAVHSAASKVSRAVVPAPRSVPQSHVTTPAVTVHGHARRHPRHTRRSPAASPAAATEAATPAVDAVSTATPTVAVPSIRPDVTTVTSVVTGAKVPSPPALPIPVVSAVSEADATPPVALPAVPDLVATVLHAPRALTQSTLTMIVPGP
jgi:putative two-component system response regulator